MNLQHHHGPARWDSVRGLCATTVSDVGPGDSRLTGSDSILRAKRSICAACGAEVADAKAGCVVRHGTPAQTLLRATFDEPADLIVEWARLGPESQAQG